MQKSIPTLKEKKQNTRYSLGFAVVIVGLAGAQWACNSSGQTNHVAAPTVSASASGPVVTGWDGGWQKVRVKKLELSFSLPDAKNWQFDEKPNQWIVGQHMATNSQIRLKILSDAEAVNVTHCADRVREEMPSVPRRMKNKEVELGKMPSIEGWEVTAYSRVEIDPKNESILNGDYVLVAARVRRCFVMHVHTQAVGGQRTALIGQRLADIADQVTPTIVVDDVVDTGPSREPLPSKRNR